MNKNVHYKFLTQDLCLWQEHYEELISSKWIETLCRQQHLRFIPNVKTFDQTFSYFEANFAYVYYVYSENIVN